MIVKIHGKGEWKWSFKAVDFCEEWEIPKKTFYRAISKLKEMNLLEWEAKDSITVWYKLNGENSVTSDTQKDTSDTQKDTSDTSTPSKPTPSKDFSDSPYSFQIFINSLSDPERESFWEYGLKKVDKLPKQPELPRKWVEVNWIEIKMQWERSSEREENIAKHTNWSKHPDWNKWLEFMRDESPATFVLEGPWLNEENRRAIFKWADEKDLIWEEEND